MGKPISLPYPSLGALFKGREDALAQLHRRVTSQADGSATAIAGHVLDGLGGVGKTRLAVEYAWRHEADYSALLLVHAESQAELRRSLALTTRTVFDLNEQQEPRQIAAVLQWLNMHPGWLLILDNVDTPQAARAVEAELQAKVRGGRVLLTGRLAEWGGSIDAMSLDVLDTIEAAQYIHARSGACAARC